MKNIEKIKIAPDATIKLALKIISNGAIRIAIVVNKNGKLLGTLTDGDIRRGFLKGLDINSPIKSIIFKKPIIAKKKDSKEKLLKIALSKKIYQKMGLEGVTRSEFIFENGIPHLLEVNTIPGMTLQSLIPQQLEVDGISLLEFLEELIAEALRKKEYL